MEKYLEILKEIEENKIDITKLYLFSCLDLKRKDVEKQVNYCYDLWLNSDVDLDLGRLADVVSMNWNKIQKDKIFDEDIIEIVLNIV